jgi:hypothetical protein
MLYHDKYTVEFLKKERLQMEWWGKEIQYVQFTVKPSMTACYPIVISKNGISSHHILLIKFAYYFGITDGLLILVRCT